MFPCRTVDAQIRIRHIVADQRLSHKSSLLEEPTALIQRWTWRLMCNSPDRFFWTWVCPVPSTKLYELQSIYYIRQHDTVHCPVCLTLALPSLTLYMQRMSEAWIPSVPSHEIQESQWTRGCHHLQHASVFIFPNNNTSLKSILRYMDRKFCRKPKDFPYLHPESLQGLQAHQRASCTFVSTFGLNALLKPT